MLHGNSAQSAPSTTPEELSRRRQHNRVGIACITNPPGRQSSLPIDTVDECADFLGGGFDHEGDGNLTRVKGEQHRVRSAAVPARTLAD